MKKVILKCIAALCILACAFSVVQAAGTQYQYRQGAREYNDLIESVVSEPAADTEESGAPLDVNFDLLQEMNAGAVGWLYSPGTPINYPVVQSTDNSYYLKHLYNGQKNSSGSIFMDALNSPDLTDANTVIYGHNMKNGSMFASLMNYSEQWYYEQHPTLYYMINGRDFRIDVFAAYVTAAESEAYTIFFDSEETYSGYLSRTWDKSDIDTSSLEMSVNDNIMTLVTCSYGFNDSKYVVQGKVTPLN